MYREAIRVIRSGKAVRVNYLGNRALEIKAQESDQ